MGIDLNSLWDQASSVVESGLSEVQSVGVPALQASGEKWAAQVLSDQSKALTGQANQTQSQVNSAVKNIMNQPSQPGSFSSFFSQTLTNAGLSNYAGYIMVAGAAIVLYFVMGILPALIAAGAVYFLVVKK